MGPLVSIVVPVLFDAAAAARLLEQTEPDPAVEVVIADGAGDPSLAPLVRGRADVRILRTPQGRGRQMNAGAAAAAPGAGWLLFLHADSRLPAGWLDQLRACAPETVGGWFRFALDDPAWQARVLERGVRLRTRLLRLPYGDQGIFVRRPVFSALGGFQELPLLEDVEFVRRLVRAGRCVELPLPLATSSRRWRRDGWFRRSARNLVIVALYFAGVPPARLARWY